MTTYRIGTLVGIGLNASILFIMAKWIRLWPSKLETEIQFPVGSTTFFSVRVFLQSPPEASES